MTDSAGGAGSSGPDADQGHPLRPSFTPARPSSSPARTPTQAAGFSPRDDDSPGHPATELARPQPAEAPGWEPTAAVTGGPRPGGAADQGQGGSRDSWSATAQSPGSVEVRFGSGVPGAAPVGQGAASRSGGGQPGVSAEEVWRTGQLPGPPSRRGHWRRRAGTALTAALLIACGVVVYLRLHHAPLTVTGVAITSQVKNGCAVDVTGRISTNGGAGTVSYQWVFTPQASAPQPLSQSVTAGQSAVYVTVSDQGTGHGQAAQQLTLQVLGPGQAKASTRVSLSC